jgi:integrase
MTWTEVDLDGGLWTIPRHKAKNGREHQVQLSAAATSVLRSLPRFADMIFTTTLKTPVSGFADAKRRLNAAMLIAKRTELGTHKGDAIPNWTLHDLRRTATTGMARLKRRTSSTASSTIPAARSAAWRPSTTGLSISRSGARRWRRGEGLSMD